MKIGFPVYYGLCGKKIGESLFVFAGSVGGKEFVSYRLDPKKPESDVQIQNNDTAEDDGQKVLRHVVALKFKEDVSEQQKQQAVQIFRDLTKTIPQIKKFEGGPNVSTMGMKKDFTHWFVLTFDNGQDRDIYMPHPEHMKVVEQNKPLLADLLVVEFWGTE